ncbi:MAG TPA: hypothetical protein VEK34_16090 [Methylocella sp.]|nr:hypothetical protein [Methylocella sp.]
MGALSDPKLEKFCQALLVNIAQGMPRSKAAASAAKTAGYGGKSMASNARKRATLPQVKARMIELAAPAQQQAEGKVVATVEDANRKLGAIAGVPFKPECVKPSDQIAAMALKARINGWLAPEKTELTSPIKIERITRVIIEPNH